MKYLFEEDDFMFEKTLTLLKLVTLCFIFNINVSEANPNLSEFGQDYGDFLIPPDSSFRSEPSEEDKNNMTIVDELANSFEDPEFNVGTINYLISNNRDELSNSVIYFFVTAYNMEKFAPYLAHSLKLNYERLKQYGVDLHVRLKCDGRVEDSEAFSKAFDEEQFPRSNIKITKNDQNKGCAQTRLEQLLEAKGEIEESIRLGKNVWISIFDGDDMLHQDSLLLRLVIGLHTGSDAVTMRRFFSRCGESKEVLDGVRSLLTRSIDTESFLTRRNYGISDYTDNLLDARNLYANAGFSGQPPLNEISQGQERDDVDLSTLMALDPYYLDVIEVFSGNTRNNPPRALDAPLIENILNGKHQPPYTPLLFYVQQSKSLEHTQLELLLENHWSNEQNFRRYLEKCTSGTLFFYDMHDTWLLFGAFNKISDKFLVTPEQNKEIDREKLLETFQYNHRLALEMERFLDEKIGKGVLEKYIWEPKKDELFRSTNIKELLKQDMKKPLSREFMESFYKDVFDTIFAGQRSNPIE